MSHQFSLRWQPPTANGDLRWACQAVEIWWDFESLRSRNTSRITGTISASPWCMGFVVGTKIAHISVLGFLVMPSVTNFVREQVTTAGCCSNRLNYYHEYGPLSE